MPAVVAAAAISAAGTVYASSQASAASDRTTDAQTQAQQNALDAQTRQFQQTQQNLAPYMAAGPSGLQNLDQFLSQMIPGYKPMYSSQPDWDAYLRDNPDAAEWVQAKAQQPDGIGRTPQQLAQQHYQLDGSRRTLNMTPGSTQPVASGEAPPMVRPDAGTAPSPWDHGVAMGPPTALEYLQGYKESDAYRAKTKLVTRDVNSGYAAKGMNRWGTTIEALATKINELADMDRGSWVKERLSALGYDQAGYAAKQRNYQTALQQYNVNRNVLNDTYSEDRNFDYGAIFDLIRLGQNSSVGVGNFGQAYANQVSNAYGNIGNAQAQNALSQGANNISTAGSLTGIANNVLNNWPSRAPNYNIAPVDPYGYGGNIFSSQASPGYVPNFTATPDFNTMFS